MDEDAVVKHALWLHYNDTLIIMQSLLFHDFQSQVEEKWIKHYSSRHRILLVGEGDFSFAASLADAFGDASNMVATSKDSEVMVRYNHPSAVANLATLKDKWCTVLHGVDATTMTQHPGLRWRSFDRIVFNFPHAGFFGREDNPYIISLHQDVVRGFLRNGYNMVTEKGEIHITHKNGDPYSRWDIPELGEEVGLKLIELANFSSWDYPGYVNKRGAGNRSDQTFPAGISLTFKFAKS